MTNPEDVTTAAGGSPLERGVRRLRAKVAQRDRRIAGLERRLAETNALLVSQMFEVKRIPLEVERAVQRALCNVRMIPVLGLRGNDKIVEIRNADKPPNV